MTADRDFMAQALTEAQKALAAGEFPVGCVIVADGRLRAAGARTGTAAEERNEIDHAEMTALRRFQENGGIESSPNATVYCTLEPCLMCFGAILISGIGRIVYAYEDVMGGGTRCDRRNLPPLYRDRSLKIVPGVLRSRSLALFKTYFQNPENDYWRQSLLARYTLAQ